MEGSRGQAGRGQAGRQAGRGASSQGCRLFPLFAQAAPHSKVVGHEPHVMVALAWICQEPLDKHKSLCGDEVWNGGAIPNKIKIAS